MKGSDLSEADAATTGSGEEALPATTRRSRHPPRLAGGETRALPAAQITELNDDYLAVVELMTFGLDEPGEIRGEWIEAHVPFTLTQAARAMNLRLRRAREMMRDCKAFQAHLNNALAARRTAERPRNLTTAIAIRDDEGDKSAATKTVRLKAIQSIEGTDQGGLSVTIHNINSQANVQPGYVIRLKSDKPDSPMIEGKAEPRKEADQ